MIFSPLTSLLFIKYIRKIHSLLESDPRTQDLKDGINIIQPDFQPLILAAIKNKCIAHIECGSAERKILIISTILIIRKT